jgi:hypothetical protein
VRRLITSCCSLLAGALLVGPVIAATNLALDNILVSKTNGITRLQIWPACRMSYIDHLPANTGLEIRIRVRTDGGCAVLLNGIESETYRPLGRRLGSVSEIEFEVHDDGDSFITVRFTTPQRFEVRRERLNWIEVFVDTNVDSQTLSANVPPPLRVEPPQPLPRPATPSSSASPPRRALRRRQVSSAANGEFVVQLGVFDNLDKARTGLLRVGTKHFAYTTDFNINGRHWYGLQLGFFDTEVTAEAALTEVRGVFPDSWVRYVTPNEAHEALSRGQLRASQRVQVRAVHVTKTDRGGAGAMALRSDNGRKALLDRRYEDAILDYTFVLEHPGHEYRATAREYIGIAHERNGQLASAVAEYRAYLSEFPDAEGVARVQLRLTSLLAAKSHSAAGPATARISDSSGWQIYGGISQYFWRNEEQLVHDGNTLVRHSGVLALGDVTASRRGRRFDVLARVNGAYQFNLVEFDDAGDIGWLSTAYVDVVDNQLGFRTIVGRQARRDDGVLDRFDGLALSYQWKPDLSLNLSTGSPIDSPRYISDSRRFFYAASVKIENIWDKVGVSAFTHQQTVDGITDRQAVGGEVQYRDGQLHVVGLLDYDVSFNVLNTFLVNSSWQLERGWRLNGSLRFGAQPYLTTRNALAGQTASSIDELLNTFTEGQIRTLARDRTAQATTVSAGIALSLSERIELSVDVSMRQSDATRASGGVASIPETGNQMFYNLTLVGSSLLKQRDLTILTLRNDATRTRDSSMLMIESRLPFGEGLRINPRLSLVYRTDKLTSASQTIVSPSIRVIYRWHSLMVDFEAGGRWSSRELPPTELDPFTIDGTEELAGGFVNIGYRWDF